MRDVGLFISVGCNYHLMYMRFQFDAASYSFALFFLNTKRRKRDPLRPVFTQENNPRIGTKFNLHMRLRCQFFAQSEAILHL